MDTANQLLHCIRKFKRFNSIEDTVYGLKKSEMMMLMAIYKGNKEKKSAMTVSELSTDLNITSPSVTQVINVLEKKSFVKRVNDTFDRRIVRITLTNHGEAITKNMREKIMKNYQELVSYLGEEKSVLLIELLDEVYDYFSKEKKETDSKGGCNE